MKHFFLIFALFTLTTIFAQTKKTSKKTPKEAKVVNDTVIEEAPNIKEVMSIESDAPIGDDNEPLMARDELDEPPLKKEQVISTYNTRFSVSYSTDKFDVIYDQNRSYNEPSYGVTEKVTGKVILPMIFSRISYGIDNQQDLILQLNDRYGIYKYGQGIVLPIEYQSIISFKKNYYLVNKNGTTGLLDQELKEVIPLQYSEINSVESNSENNLDLLIIKNKEKTAYGLYSTLNKKFIIPIEYENMTIYGISNNYLLVKKNNKHTMINYRGENLFKNWYDKLYSDSDEILIAVKNGNYGIIDYDEKIIVPFKYKTLEKNWRSKLYKVTNENNKYGFIDHKGKVIVPLEYDEIDFSNDGNYVAKTEGKCDILKVMENGEQKKIYTCDYDGFSEVYGMSLYVIKKNGKYGFINNDGEVKLAIEYDEIINPVKRNYSTTSTFIVIKNKKYGLIDANCKVILDAKYESIAKNGDNGEYIVKQNGKEGLYTSYGIEYVPFQFDKIIDRIGEYLIVESNSKCGIYNISNKKYILEPTNEFITKVSNTKKEFLVFQGVKLKRIFFSNDGKVMETNE